MDNLAHADILEPTKLITVHGTSAGDLDSVEGHRWWQLNSTFQKELEKRIHLDRDTCEVVPFRWDIGPNSEAQRRLAGAALLDLLKEHEDAGAAYYLIGHSHGGSVIYHALLKSVHQGKKLTGLRQWCTVGTPFLDYRANRFMFQRLSGAGLTAYSTGVFALLLAMVYWVIGQHNAFDFIARAEYLELSPEVIAHIANWDFNQVMHNFALALTIYGVSCVVLLFFLERHKKGWANVKEKQQVEAWYGATWCGLWHRDDEAISALLNVQRVAIDIVPSTFLTPIVGFLQLFLVWGTGLMLCFDIVFKGGQKVGAFAFWLSSPYAITDEETGAVISVNDTGLIFGSSGSHWSGMIEGILLTLIVLALVGWLLTKGLRYLVKKLGRPLAFILNGIVWRSVRNTAWGDDLLAEDVHFVGASPPLFDRKFGPLPSVVATPLSKHSDANAIETLSKVRKLLGMTEGTGAQADVRSELGDTLNWQELIHTSYFEVPTFVDLIAVSLVSAGLGSFKEGFDPAQITQQTLEDLLRLENQTS
jgi:hypothetical protein